MKFVFGVLVALFLAGCVQAQSPQSGSSKPAKAASTVQKALAGSGVKVSGEMEAPKGFHGFVGNYQGRQLPVYLLPDGKHIAIGTLIDTSGQDLTSAAMQKAADSRFSEADWKALADSTWVGEGNPKAQRIVYVFVDTRCPFCHRLWQMTQPFMKGDEVQIRNIMVAVISPDSLPEGADVLDASDPSKAWQENEKNFGHNPKPEASAGSAASRTKIKANNELMQKLGFFGTPAIVYKDADGKIHSRNGVPQDPRIMQEIFGKR
jgi:thiol:disulfide interchange protein DsbG